MISYNCYRILEDVRHALNEHSEAYVQGTDTTGKYSNGYLLNKINNAYRQLFALLANENRMAFFFQTSVAITGVDSVFTLPGDYGSLIEFRDDDGKQVFPIRMHDIRVTSITGSDREYYRQGNTLVLNRDGIAGPYTLWYSKKCRDLITGQASAGGAASITLATDASKIVDFYNNQQIENITKDWLDTITDYATTRVATIAETAAASDYYGTVPEIPEPFQHLIAEMATLKVQAEFPLAQSQPSMAGLTFWDLGLADILADYGNDTADVPAEEVFEDFDDDNYGSF